MSVCFIPVSAQSHTTFPSRWRAGWHTAWPWALRAGSKRCARQRAGTKRAPSVWISADGGACIWQDAHRFWHYAVRPVWAGRPLRPCFHCCLPAPWLTACIIADCKTGCPGFPNGPYCSLKRPVSRCNAACVEMPCGLCAGGVGPWRFFIVGIRLLFDAVVCAKPSFTRRATCAGLRASLCPGLYAGGCEAGRHDEPRNPETASWHDAQTWLNSLSWPLQM